MLTELLDCIKATNITNTLSSTQLCDEFVCACIRHCNDTAMIEAMIKVLDSDLHKINCYLLIGKLKQAYLLAVKLGRTSDVHLIRTAATSSGQEAVRRICEMWLEKRNTPDENSTNTWFALIIDLFLHESNLQSYVITQLWFSKINFDLVCCTFCSI